MAQTECKRCRGTGYASAARDSGTEDAHWLHVQMGVYKCPNCNGKGRIGFSEEEKAMLRKIVERMGSNVK